MIFVAYHQVVDKEGNQLGIEGIDIEIRSDNMVVSPVDNVTPMHRQDFLKWLQLNPAEMKVLGWLDPSNGFGQNNKWNALTAACNHSDAHPEAKALGLKPI